MRHGRAGHDRGHAGGARQHSTWPWGRGSSFPFSGHDDLSDAVVGRGNVPSPGACYAVAGVLTLTAACLVADTPRVPRAVQHLGVTGVALVLATRAGLGFAGRTDVASPGSVSTRFRRLDRRVYSPLCLALAAGAFSSRRDLVAREHPHQLVASRVERRRTRVFERLASRRSWSRARPRTTL